MTYSAIPSAVQASAINTQIANTVQRLRQLNQLDVQANWRSYLGDLPPAQATQFNTWQSWRPVTLNSNRQVTWEKGQRVLWLGQRIVVPHNLQGYYLQGLMLRLGLTWWASLAQIYVNGQLVQAGDLFDSVARILLSRSVQIGQTIDVALRLVSPGHSNGALVRGICLYELASQTVNPTAEPAFVADEVAVLQEFLNAFAPDRLPQLANALAQLPWSVLTVTDRPSFDRGLAALRQQLQPLSSLVKARQIHLSGHAHLDMAWLWPVRETWQVAENTFRSVLNLQKDFPELIFSHTSPALYAWMEQNRPDLFAAIQAKVQSKQWDVSIAPLWIEPDMNLGNGESIARQLLYGQRYLQQRFGSQATIAWLPDTFGFNWQLPQFLKQGGVNYFATQKLRWNDTTRFPHQLHQWQAPDGSQILSLHSAPIGEGIDPVKMARYVCDWERNTGRNIALWLPGVGDHGGGPTRDMLEQARRWQQSPFFPKLQFTQTTDFLKTVESAETPLPIWNSELYLELHRGCYINHSDQKWFNRRCEDLLYEAELFASLSTLLTGATYPQAALETAWKKVLFNHFHDILPGTSIPEVFIDANQDWQAALDTGWNVRQQAMQQIAAAIDLPATPHPQAQLVTVFNAMSWVRSELVTVSIQQTQDERACFWQITDLDSREIPTQPHCWRENGQTYCQIFFRAEVPATGYRCFWLLPRSIGNPVPPTTPLPGSNPFVMENDRLQVILDPRTGHMSRLFDKVHRRDLLSRPGNELQFFRDSGQYWDAWDIAPNYAQNPLPPAQLTQIFYEDRGSLTTRIRVIRRIGQSTFNQVYILDQGSAVVKIATQANWQERRTLVKAAFSFNINAAYATYEIPNGAIQRTTRPQTPAEQAKWEVPALRWADLSDTVTQDSYGISLLSDCKQGYDASPDRLRLSLLRGSEWPDPNSDRGEHQFTYGVYAHDRDWRTAQTVRQAYALNQPLRVMLFNPSTLRSTRTLPARAGFIDLPPNVMLSTCKPAEDNPNQWILRLYEAHGRSTNLNWPTQLSDWLQTQLDLNSVQAVNLLEQVQSGASAGLRAWQIATYRFDRK